MRESIVCLLLWIVPCSAIAQGLLTLHIDATPSPASPGELIQYRITVANAGDATLSSVALEATVPVHTTVSRVNTLPLWSAPNTNNFAAGSTFGWNVGSLAPGESRTHWLGARVLSGVDAPADGAEILLEATVSATGLEVLVESSATPVLAARPLTLELIADQDQLLPGAVATCVLHYGNSGVQTLQGLRLEVPLPENATFIDATGNPALDGDVLAWELGTLSPGEIGQRWFRLEIPAEATAGEVIDLQALISATSPAGAASAAAALLWVRPPAHDALVLAIDANPLPAIVGGLLQYRLTVSNQGDFAIANVLLNGRIPTNTTISRSNTQPTWSAPNTNNLVAGGIYGWDVGTLQAGQSKTYWVSAVALSPPDGTTLLFDAHLISPVGWLTQRHAAAIQANPRLSLQLTPDRDQVSAGDRVTYQVDFANLGELSSQGVRLEVRLPVDTEFLEASEAAIPDGDTITWEIGTLGTGVFDRHWFAVSVADEAMGGEDLRSSAQLSDSGTPRNTAFAESLVWVRPEAGSELRMAIDAASTPAVAGRLFYYRIVVTNAGDAPIAGLTLNGRIPVGATISRGNTYPAWSAPNTNNFGAGVIHGWTVGTLQPGESRTYLLGALPLARPAGSPMVFEAHLTGPAAWLTRRHATPVVADSGLDLRLTTDRDQVSSGAEVAWTLDFANASQVSASAVQVSLRLPEGFDVIESPDDTEVVGDVLLWNVGTLSAGDFGRHRVVTTAPAEFPPGTEFQAQATLSDGGAARRWTHAEAVVCLRTASANALGLAVETEQIAVQPGDLLRYTLRLRNNSGATLEGVELVAPIPVHTTVRRTDTVPAWSAPNTNAFAAGNIFGWVVGSMAPGQEETFELGALVLSGGSAPRDGTPIILHPFAKDASDRPTTLRHVTPVGIVPQVRHTADRNSDGTISLSELLRVIQFYNSGGLHCALPPESTEDGYVPGANDAQEACVPHNSDYSPQDWRISLSELLRLIQFYNSGGYFACPDAEPPTEDGMCPGAP